MREYFTSCALYIEMFSFQHFNFNVFLNVENVAFTIDNPFLHYLSSADFSTFIRFQFPSIYSIVFCKPVKLAGVLTLDNFGSELVKILNDIFLNLFRLNCLFCSHRYYEIEVTLTNLKRLNINVNINLFHNF